MTATIARRRRATAGRLVGLLTLTVVALAVAAPGAQAATHYVNVSGLTWSPSDLTVSKGDTVVWSFGEALEDHTVTSLEPRDAPSGARSWGALAVNEYKGCETGTGDVARTFTEEGVYHYHCQIHPEMRGVVRVRGTSTRPNTGASTQGRNVRLCPAFGTPPPPPPGHDPSTHAPPPAPGPAPLVNTGDVAPPAAPRLGRLAVRGRSRVIELRFALLDRATVTARFRSVRTRRVIHTVRLRGARVGRNVQRIRRPRSLRRGRYRVELTPSRGSRRGPTVRATLTLR